MAETQEEVAMRKAARRLALSIFTQHNSGEADLAKETDLILAALRAQYVAGLLWAAELCDGRAANMEEREALEIAALQLRGAAEGIRELAEQAKGK